MRLNSYTFDVLMPGEPRQYHVNVNLNPDFGIKSISYINGPKRSDGTTLVMLDLADADVVVTVSTWEGQSPRL